ncbi:uncharacterized protein KY384_000761 [Bacidia gigantensis]|uniref:uncharacterized protein n=1 Tax=Bacidia gigantensis TaxID=2732470 RepID=UPI001D04DBAA|nr:uncharacterized protein KY384_000761 [Bacidia gigantensis]KAG8525999.1 hypothetical protein KY384_000761 [Bacidia gigantensis]
MEQTMDMRAPHTHFDMSSEHHHPHSHTDMQPSTPPMPMEKAPPASAGHNMHPDDPDNPQNAPLFHKIHASLSSSAFAFMILFGATAYTSSLAGVQARFSVSMTVSILPFSLYFWGIAFAPIYTPHVSERYGRRPVYLVSLPLFAIFILGASVSQSFAALCITRFLAGLAGGPCVVLIEGTFADVWSAKTTVTYYVFLTCASFVGAGAGAIVGNYIFVYGGWRWTQWITLIMAIGAYLLGVSMPETYPREILRARAKRTKMPIKLAKAQSGVTLKEMATHTLINPVKMLVAEPIVILASWYVAFIFAVIFQFFISIPVVLHLTYNFTPHQIAQAFTSAIIGTALAAFTATIIDLAPKLIRRESCDMEGSPPMEVLEHRLRSGMLGGILITASLFWIAWAAKPNIHYIAPITGTAVFIWGCALALTSIISYLFDAYPAPGTLAALTAAACFRIILAGLIPLVIIQMIMGLTGAWAVSTFAFIGAVGMGVPWVLYFFGAGMRRRSVYAAREMAEVGAGMGKEQMGGSV